MNKRRHKKQTRKKTDHSFKISIIIGCCVIALLYSSHYIFNTFSQSQKPVSNNRSTVLATQTNNLVASDTFQRSNQTHWGLASDGVNTWQAAAGSNSIYYINGNHGEVKNGNGISNGILGPSNLTDSQVLATANPDSFTNTDYGVLLRYQDNINWYKAYIDGSNFIIRRMLKGTNTILSQKSFSASAPNSYSIRFQVIGNTLSAKVWKSSNSEPSSWILTTNDNNFSSGYDGVGVSTLTGSEVAYSSFYIYNLAITPTPTTARYTCDGNTGQCIPQSQGYYTTSNCNMACWGYLTLTPTPTSVQAVNHYSCNGNTGQCDLDPQGYYTTSNCNMACWGYLTPTTIPTNNPPSQIPSITTQPTQPFGVSDTPFPTIQISSFDTPSPIPTDSNSFDNSQISPTQSSNPIQNAFSFLQDINPFAQTQPNPIPLPSAVLPTNEAQKNNLLYQEATYNPANMEFNFSKMIERTTKTPTTVFSLILNINNVIKNFIASLFQGGFSKIINRN